MNKHKKKPANRKAKKKILAGILFVLTVGVYLTAIFTLPAFTAYSDDNTESYAGRVTSVSVESEHTGYKSRKRSMVFIELDTAETFYISNLTLQKNDVEYEALKETILNTHVEIQAAQTNAEKLVTLRSANQEIITYEDINQTSQSNRVGLLAVCCIAFAFVALLLLL